LPELPLPLLLSELPELPVSEGTASAKETPMPEIVLEISIARPLLVETALRPMSAAASAYSMTSWPESSRRRRARNERRPGGTGSAETGAWAGWIRPD
jgi:hypothetical protein